MALFLYEPKFKSNVTLYITLFIIFVVAYVAMAWYDYFFNCDIIPLRRGIHSLTGQFKPPVHQKDKQLSDNIDASRKHTLVYLSHIVLIVPILAYIALKKTKVNKIVYPLLGVMAIFTAGYHGTSLMLSSH